MEEMFDRRKYEVRTLKVILEKIEENKVKRWSIFSIKFSIYSAGNKKRAYVDETRLMK